MTHNMDNMVNTHYRGDTNNPKKIYATPTSVTYNGVPSEFRSNSSQYSDGEFFTSDNQTGTVFIRINVPDLKLQKCLQFELDETVWQAKQRLLTLFSKDLKDSMNFGLYCPPMNGRAGKFMEEERLLREYPLQGPIGFLEFKYKRRVYKLMNINPRKLKQLNTKGSLKHFMDYVKGCNVEKVTKLSNKGLDPNFHDSHTGETPLSVAVSLVKQKCRELIISLAGGGAHIDYRTRKGMTPLHKAVLAGNMEAVKTLLDLGASPNLKDVRGLTPLYYGVANASKEDCVQMLLAERALIGAQDEQGWFELHHACKQGLSQHLEHLLFFGAEMDVQNASGNTPLHVCAINGRENCARLLLFRGANKEAVNYSNQTPYDSALISQNHELALIIENYKPEDVVPYKELPTYSKRRRNSIPSSLLYGLSRSRSDPRINLISGDDSMYMSPASSSHSLAYLNNNVHYADTDSPCSMSVSSASSGPSNDYHRHSMFDHRPVSVYDTIQPKLSPRLPQNPHTGSVPHRNRSLHAGFSQATDRKPEVMQPSASSVVLSDQEKELRLGIIPVANGQSPSSRPEIYRHTIYSEGLNHHYHHYQDPQMRRNKLSYRNSRLSSIPSSAEESPYHYGNSRTISVSNNFTHNHSDGDNTAHSHVSTINLMNEDSVYVCVKPFHPTRPGQLPLDQGEIIEVTGVGDQGYWEGRNSNGHEGWFPSDNLQEVKLRRRAGSLGDIMKASRDTVLNRNTLATLTRYNNNYAPRTVVLQRGPEGYGFVLRGAKSTSNTTGELDFCPTAEFPALQYLDSVDPGSRSDRAGLRSGDFLLEINGENVIRASHDRVVQLIRQAGDLLKMKVVTVKPSEMQDNWVQQHQDGSMTLPSRGASKRQAPSPPKRDPQTSISLTKSQGKQIAESMAELETKPSSEQPPEKEQVTQIIQRKKSVRAPLPPETEKGVEPHKMSDKIPPVTAPKPTRKKSTRAPVPQRDQLDKALDEYDTQGEVTQEQKTASIRSRHSAKRVSLVDLSNLENNQGEEKHMSPSEMRIKKYHQTKKQNGSVSGMERSRSTSDLLDGKRPEPVYATPVQVPTKSAKHQRSASGSGDITDKYDYRMEDDNVSLKSSASYGGSTGKLSMPPGERPKAPPPPPPGGTLPKRQAPPPPKGVEPISAAKTELVSISTNRKSIYANPAEVIPPSQQNVADNSDFESSFRPGTSAKLSDEPKIKTKALEEVKMKSHQRNASAASGRSAASEGSDSSDKHSVSFAEDKVYDSAKSFLKKHPNAQLLVTADVHLKKPAEPAPDYDLSDDETKKPAVTVISIGDKKPLTTTTKHYTIKHSDIPESSTSKDDRKEVVIPPPPQEPAPQPPTTVTTRPASPPLRTSSVSIEERQIKVESKVEVKVDVEVAPPAAAPPPPPPPPPVAPATSIPSTPVMPKKTPELPSNVAAIPTGDILAAVQKRQTRLQSEGVKLTPLPEKKVPQNDTQAALLAAVAKRRSALLQKSENEVVDSIEQRLNKSKKLHAAKFSSDNIKKAEKDKPAEPKTTVAPKVSPKSEVKPKEKYVFKLGTDIPAAKPVFSSETSKSATTSQSKVTTTTVTKTTEVSNGTDSVQQQSAKDKVKDFLAEAERARQEWLQKKAAPSFRKSEDSKPVVTKTSTRSTSSLVTTTTNETRKISAPAVKTSPAPVPVSNRSSIILEKKPVPIDIVINTKVDNKPKANGVVRKDSIITTQPVQKMSDKLGIMPVKGRDTELASNKTSIRDRIASFEKNKANEAGSNNRKRSTSPSSARYTVHGVTTDSSVTDKKTSALPPPPGFGDAVQIDIIPPPTSFRPQQDNDAASVVSSLSTLSTLSDEHADSGYSPSKHSYDEVIPPPPPGFDDTNDLGYDEIPSVIPPPPDFESNENNNNIKVSSRVDKPFVSKSVDMWQCLDVLDWLDSLNLSQYKPKFQSHCIDGKKLVGLSRSDYIDLGVAQVGHRMNLERSIKKVALRKSVTS